MPIKREDVANIINVLESFFKTTLDDRGRIYLPKEVRDKLSIREGDKIYIKVEDNRLTLYTAKMIEREQRKTSSMLNA